MKNLELAVFKMQQFAYVAQDEIIVIQIIIKQLVQQGLYK